MVDVTRLVCGSTRCPIADEVVRGPNTGWLSGSGLALDAKRFVLTGAEAGEHRRPLETSRHGIFAIGDIRSGSVKRVAAAVGEGAQVVAALHAHLSRVR